MTDTTKHDYTSKDIDAARRLLGAGEGAWAQQAYEVVLREADRYDDDPRLVWFVPIGNVIGIATKRGEERPTDKDWVFVPLAALGAALPAFGFIIAKEAERE